MEKNRNYFIAIALSVVIVLAWQFLYMNPRIEQQRRAEEARQAQQQTTQQQQPAPGAAPGAAVEGAPPASSPQTAATATREESIARTQRVAIDTNAIAGSINLTGARFDDIRLKDYHETVDDSSPIITLFSPADTKDGYFTELGYVAAQEVGGVPGPTTVWTLASGDKLTENTPVTLTYTNAKGVIFSRTVSIDEHYMISVADKVENPGQAAISFATYGRVTRNNKPAVPPVFVIHEGFLGVSGKDGSLTEEKYKDVEEAPVTVAKATGGWLGITDKYWAAAIVPPQTTPFETRYSHITGNQPSYQADFKSDPMTVEPGQSIELKSLVFAGAKEVPLVDRYETTYAIPKFDLLIDWGWFYFITKPMFKMMDFFFRYFGNFGVAILLTTIVVKALFFPLASKQYASMANMKRVQPKMEELKAKHGDDRMAMQQAMMQLYKEEKINPVAGCWPMLLQIPVFFALYKVIGVWPLVMGITMFLQMRMNPTPPDPTQAMIFNWMPLIFTFMLASFPAGLVIYWAWNNTLSITQQAVIMKRQGAKIELFDNIKGLFKRKPVQSK